jgi:nucleoside-diphosphate-sugar epimerase
MKTKILICGSTGFLMTNFIRYVLYRSKDFDIVSVDGLENPKKDIKRIYFNKKHKFYVGDISNKDFIERIICLEKPDIIIYGDEICDYEFLLKTTLNLIGFGLPIIAILPVAPSNDLNLFCSPIKSILIKNGHTAIEMPNKFGMRQRPSLLGLGSNVAWIIKNYIFEKRAYVSDVKLPWVYAEDVASFMWYVIENMRPEVIKMPPLGFMSEKEIAEKIESLYKKNYLISVNKEHSKALVVNYEWDETNWVPDSKDLDSVLEKTIRWFDANRWALEE